MKQVHGKKVIVTGASSGIGERITWHIAKNGGIPIMVARSLGKLKRQREMIRREWHTPSFVYHADLTEKDELESVFHQILAEQGPINGLVNNAGTGVFEYVETMNMKYMERMFQLNVFALIQATKLLIDHFLANGGGHIVNIASQAGKIATPKSAVYAASKHAVIGFTNALRQEVTGKGIGVTAVNLGPVRTNFFDTADPSGSYVKNVGRYMLDPDKVAERIVRHLFTNKREINMPRWMDVGSRMYQVFPGVMEKLLAGQFRKK